MVNISRSKIRARISFKSAVRRYDEGRHQFFFFDIMDGSVKIRVKAFDEECNRIISNVAVGKVILFVLDQP